jgi:membrane-associated phospholipid phosphatase
MRQLCQIGVFVIAAYAGLGGLTNQAGAQVNQASLPDNPSPAFASGDASPAGAWSFNASPDGALPESSDGGAAGPERQQVPDSPNEREATWKTLPGNFLSDQKSIWMFPTQLARGRHWVPVLAVSGVTAGLIVADPHVMPYFRNHARNLDKMNDGFDPLITTAEVILLPAALMTSGYIRHDQRMVSTALLCAQAYADAAVPNLAIKAITRRERPTDIPPGGDFHGTFFNAGKSPFRGSSFPSGHSTGAFSVATVVATRYQKHRWVPYLAYGMATVISLSRITTAAHFPSDVFLGAAMGYSIARFETMRPR